MPSVANRMNFIFKIHLRCQFPARMRNRLKYGWHECVIKTEGL